MILDSYSASSMWKHLAHFMLFSEALPHRACTIGKKSARWEWRNSQSREAKLLAVVLAELTVPLFFPGLAFALLVNRG